MEKIVLWIPILIGILWLIYIVVAPQKSREKTEKPIAIAWVVILIIWAIYLTPYANYF